MEDKQVITLRIPYLQGIEGTPAEGSSAEIVIKDVHLWKLKQNGLALAYPLEQRIRELEDAANLLLNRMENDESSANVAFAFDRLRAVVDKSINSYEEMTPAPVKATASGPWSSGDHERLANDTSWIPFPEMLRAACEKPSLVEALSYAATVCTERAIRQAFRNARSGERGPRGELWETTFQYDFGKVLEGYRIVQAAPVGGVAGVPLPGADSLLTWIKGLVAAAELCEQHQIAAGIAKPGPYPYDPPCIWGDEPREALALARKLGWVGGKIGEIPALVTTEKQEPKVLTQADRDHDHRKRMGQMWPWIRQDVEGTVATLSAEPDPLRNSFQRDLQQLINKHSLENRSNTPDFVLASLLESTLKTWELHAVERDRWFGNRSLLGPGNDVAVGTVQTSEKTLLPGIDLTKPRPLIDEALGRAAPLAHTLVLTQPGLMGAVNDLCSFHNKFGMPWITGEPMWPGKKRMDLRRELVREECLKELGDALEHLETFLSQRGLAHSDAGPVTQDAIAPGGKGEFRARMAAVADGIIDSIYVLIGMGGEMGLDLTESWRRVHAANMAKEGGGKRPDGKVLKPEGWVPPDVEGAIFKSP